MPKKCSLCFRAAIISRFFFKPQNPRLTSKRGFKSRVAQDVACTVGMQYQLPNVKLVSQELIHFFFIIKIKPPAQTCKSRQEIQLLTLSLGLYMEFITAAHCTMIMIKKISSIKKHWKLKYEKYTGFKAQMEKNRPIRDQFPNKNRVPIVKNPRFSWLYGLPMVP